MKKLNMKKTTTAAVAATVGAVLLLGGAGTLAYWQDSTSSRTQVVSSGKLDLGTVEDATWQVAKNGSTTFSTLTGNVVPGDTLKTEFLVPAELVGQNLNSQLTVTPDAPSGTLSTKATVTVAIAGEAATVIPAATVPPAAPTPPVSVIRTFTPDTLSKVTTAGKVKVTVTVTFPFSAPNATTYDNSSLDSELATISLDYELKQLAN